MKKKAESRKKPEDYLSLEGLWEWVSDLWRMLEAVVSNSSMRLVRSSAAAGVCVCACLYVHLISRSVISTSSSNLHHNSTLTKIYVWIQSCLISLNPGGRRLHAERIVLRTLNLTPGFIRFNVGNGLCLSILRLAGSAPYVVCLCQSPCVFFTLSHEVTKHFISSPAAGRRQPGMLMYDRAN